MNNHHPPAPTNINNNNNNNNNRYHDFILHDQLRTAAVTTNNSYSSLSMLMNAPRTANNINNNISKNKTRRRKINNNKKTILAHGVDEIPSDINFSNSQHMIAGAMAGVVEHAFMFPVDTIKTRMQTLSASVSNVGMIQVWNNIRAEGYLRMYSGLTAVLSGAIPSHALYFATYEFAKDCLHNRRIRTSSTDSSVLMSNGPLTAPDPIITGIAGIMATVVHDGISTPLDVIKQRMQINANYRNMLSCCADVMKTEGIRAFFLSYPTTLMMNIPYTLVHFIGYETFKFMLHQDDHHHHHHDHDHDHHDEHHHDDHDHHHHHHHQEVMWKHFVAGGAAGALAAAVSNPFDVMKTRLQTQGPKEYNGVKDVVIQMMKKEGFRGFLRGVTPRMLYHTPSAAITWATYEYMKVIFKKYSFSVPAST